MNADRGQPAAESHPGNQELEDQGTTGTVTEQKPNPESEETPRAGVCPVVVGIGASAGGLDAFTQMLKHLPSSTGMAFVLIQHLDPNHESMLTTLLSGQTSMPVQEAGQGIEVEPNRIYVTPPNSQMAIKRGALVLTPRTEDGAPNLPIDFFLSSLARDQKSRSVGVILSGAASDGTTSLGAIKAAGGITFAQDGSAKIESMPRNAIAAAKALDREVQGEDGRWYSLRVQPYRTGENRVGDAVLQLLDIDQLKLSLEEMQHAREYAEAIIETVREPLLVLDQELCIRTANGAFFAVFGASPEKTLHHKIDEIDNGQWNMPKVTDLFKALTRDESGAIQEVEVEQEFARLGFRSFRVSARRIYRSTEAGLILLALEDITDRKKASEEKYRRLFDAAKDGIIIVDAVSGEIADVNPFILDLFGLNRNDVIGKHLGGTPLLADCVGIRSALERLPAKDIVKFPDFTVRAKDGRQIEIEVVGSAYYEGAKLMVQLNIRDITERKDFNRQQQLQQTARLESLGVLAGGIAHDFNNLLAGILGNAGLALADAPPDSPYHSALKDVVHASQRAADLTRQMLAYAGKGRSVVRPVNLSELVRDITNLVRSSIPKSVELELDIAQGLPPIEADASQMQQILMNLVINGAEAIGEGNSGKVRICTRVQQLDAEYIRANFPSGELAQGAHVVLEVADTGSGMDEKTRNRIFDPFFTTKFTGRGLGLASVQGILRTHHGAIRVESALGQGTTFRAFLPAIAETERRPDPDDDPQHLYGSGSVLIIDDEEIVLRTTGAILARHGYRVLTAANGERGVQVVSEKKDELRLVVLDLTMPVMGGEETLARIKKIAPDLPVVLSSGYDASQAMSRFGKSDIAGFIQKPATVTDYLRTVKEALRDDI